LIFALKHKYVPGYISSFINQSVIQAILSYRLQCTILTRTQYSKLDVTVRRLIKQNYQVPRSFPTCLLAEQDGIKLVPFEETHQQRLISSFFQFLRSAKASSVIVQACIAKFSNGAGMEHDIFYTPITLPQQNRYLLPYVSSQMLHLQIAFRPLPKHASQLETAVADLMTHNQYNTHHRHLKQLRIKYVNQSCPSRPTPLAFLKEHSPNLLPLIFFRQYTNCCAN
jgi:hypothetical protein